MQVQIQGLETDSLAEIILHFYKVEDAVDNWPVVVSPSAFTIENDVIYANVPDPTRRGSGLYLLEGIEIRYADGKKSRELRNREFGYCLYEVRVASAEAHSADELVAIYQAKLSARDADFRKGFGEMLGTPGTVDYEGLVFVQDCLIRFRRRLGQYELIPFDNLPLSDELDHMKRYLAKTNNPVPLASTVDWSRAGHPTLVVHFPRVIASSPDNAITIMTEEVELLSRLLSLHRGGSPSIFGVLVRDLADNKIGGTIVMPHYPDDIGDGSFDDDSELLKNRMAKVRNRPELRLYLDLFREAKREKRPRFAYFRYWSLLETTARSKRFQAISSSAEKQVYELIRRVCAQHNLSETSHYYGKEYKISDMIPIWYRRRNCIAHGGEEGECWCYPNPSIGKPSLGRGNNLEMKLALCEQAHNEVLAQPDGPIDGYLRNLERVVRDVLFAELV